MAVELQLFIFLSGYLLIALEHLIRVDKAGVALFMGIVLWIGLALNPGPAMEGGEELSSHFVEIAEILFFLLGAMTIVELIDAHQGFSLVLRLVRTSKRTTLLWILSSITFVLSAVLDNLTTTIVMVALIRKFLDQERDQWFFAGFVVIAANAGGAWSPIGDVTTIMLWNSGHISSSVIIRDVFLPSLICLLVPLLVVTLFPPAGLKNSQQLSDPEKDQSGPESRIILLLGVALLLFVPVFKAITHLPPFMGMLFSLSVLWLSTELMHKKKAPEIRHHYSVAATLQRIDTPSILFFLGILLAVAALDVNGVLAMVGKFLEEQFSDFYMVNTLLGLLSSLVDNVPLVAGAVGMYPLEQYPPDHRFWTLLAYCAGTGGSTLIIGSAAGVAAMGILKIDFIWYLRHIALLALMGYLAGIGVYILQF